MSYNAIAFKIPFADVHSLQPFQDQFMPCLYIKIPCVELYYHPFEDHSTIPHGRFE